MADYVGKTFTNCELVLGGNSFEGCTFENVTFLIDGTRGFVRGCTFVGSPNVGVIGDLAGGIKYLAKFAQYQPDPSEWLHRIIRIALDREAAKGGDMLTFEIH